MLARSATYTTQGNARSLTHWVRPGIEPVSLWMLIRFISVKPWWELHNLFILSLMHRQPDSQGPETFTYAVPSAWTPLFSLPRDYLACSRSANFPWMSSNPLKHPSPLLYFSGQQRSFSWGLHHSQSHWMHSRRPYASACNTRSLTHWARPEIQDFRFLTCWGYSCCTSTEANSSGIAKQELLLYLIFAIIWPFPSPY